MPRKLTGRLFDYFETGCEGVVWAIEVDPDQQGSRDLAYGRFEFVDPRDHLRITAPDGTTVFDDIIRPDWYRGWEPRPYQWHWIGKLLAHAYIRRFVPTFLWHRMNRKGYFIGQATACGLWIHWTQRGWKAEAWARLFIRMKGEESYRAELTKAEVE